MKEFQTIYEGGDAEIVEKKSRFIAHTYHVTTEEEVQEVLKQRRLAWKPKERKYKKGVLRLFSELAASPMKGAYLEYDK